MLGINLLVGVGPPSDNGVVRDLPVGIDRRGEYVARNYGASLDAIVDDVTDRVATVAPSGRSSAALLEMGIAHVPRVLRDVYFGKATTIVEVGSGARDEHAVLVRGKIALVGGELGISECRVASIGVRRDSIILLRSGDRRGASGIRDYGGACANAIVSCIVAVATGTNFISRTGRRWEEEGRHVALPSPWPWLWGKRAPPP